MPLWIYIVIKKIRIKHHISIAAMENNAILTEEIIPISNTGIFSSNIIL